MIKTILLFLTFFIFANASTVPPEVELAISQALSGKWVFQNFEKKKQSMGFDSTTHLSDIKPGDPFELCTISQLTFEEAGSDVNVDSLIEPGNWYVPLYVNGKLSNNVMLIGTRFSDNGEYSAGMSTSFKLAETWDKIKKTWPQEKSYNPKLVYIAEPMENNLCFYIPEKGPHNLTIIGKLYREFEPWTDSLIFSELRTSEETFRSIKTRIAEIHRKSDSSWAETKRVNDSLAHLKDLATEKLWKKYETGNIEPVVQNSEVTSSWNNMLVKADEAIIPYNLSKVELQKQKPEAFIAISRRLEAGEGQDAVVIDSNIVKSALPLRIGAEPIDRTISKGKDDWYELLAKDGTGLIRIGSTGPLLVVDAPFKDGQHWGLGGSRSSYPLPENGADLIEISAMSPTEFALRWNVEKAFLQIHSENAKPIHYRISFVREMPDVRTGCQYGPGVAAEKYMQAVAFGDSAGLYTLTRSRFTVKQITMLQKRLYGVNETVRIFAGHRRSDALEINAEGELHVQHPIVSVEYQNGNRKGLAFEIICFKKDGLWLVADAYRDPSLSDKQVEEIVKADYESLSKGH